MAIRILFPLIAVLLMLPGCVPARPAAPLSSIPTVITGKVSDHRQPIAGVEVAAYPAAGGTLSGPAPYAAAPSMEDGRFELELPTGTYYLLARGEGWFSYYGRNPVTVPEQGLADLNIGLVATAPPPNLAAPFIDSGIAGRVLWEGRPLAGALLYVYTDLTSDLKGMGYVMGGPTDADGYFEVAVPAGTYYVLARKRSGAASVGPLRAGDFAGYFPGNPVRVGAADVVAVTVPMLVVPDKVNNLQGSLFGQTSIRGRIIDHQGAPVAGVRAVLYSDPQMLNRPLYVSAPTTEDGTYVLSFPSGGTYYLAARNTLGGAPGPGDLYGTWDGNPDHALEVAEGAALTGLDIVVEEMW